MRHMRGGSKLSWMVRIVLRILTLKFGTLIVIISEQVSINGYVRRSEAV